jgi:hypothetical protein
MSIAPRRFCSFSKARPTCPSAIALIPAGVPQEPLNVGSDTLCCVAYLSSAAALHTWEVPLMPMESTTFVTPPAEEGGVMSETGCPDHRERHEG